MTRCELIATKARVYEIERDIMHHALGLIARGDPKNGRPLAREAARQLARGMLIDLGFDWPKQERHDG